MVAQSASIGTKASWGPLKTLVVANATNGFGEPITHRINDNTEYSTEIYEV